MTKEVILTPLATANFEGILIYLISEWGTIVANNFIERFEQVCVLLSKNPEIFPFVSKDKLIQKCVLTKHNVIYFKETDTAVKILAIFDTRQDPDKLANII